MQVISILGRLVQLIVGFAIGFICGGSLMTAILKQEPSQLACNITNKTQEDVSCLLVLGEESVSIPKLSPNEFITIRLDYFIQTQYDIVVEQHTSPGNIQPLKLYLTDGVSIQDDIHITDEGIRVAERRSELL